MGAPYTPLKAQSLLHNRGKSKIHISDDCNGMCDDLPLKEEIAEGDLPSESDSEGELIPGPENQRTVPASKDHSQPQAQQDEEHLKLEMIHSSLLIPLRSGALRYNALNEISPFIPATSSLHACGGPLIRTHESRHTVTDYILCWPGRCTFCAKIFGPDETLDSIREAAEWEERRVIEVRKSPYGGWGFVHSKDLMEGENGEGVTFEPGVGMEWKGAVPRREECRVLEVECKVSGKGVKVECLVCQEEKCTVCAEARAEREMNRRWGEQEVGEEIAVAQPKAKRAQSKGRRKAVRGDGEEFEERIQVDEEGNVHKEYYPVGQSPESVSEAVQRGGKGKGKRKAPG